MNSAKNSAIFFSFFLLPLQGREEKSVTFSEDIAPIIFENCTTCHRPGQIGPFALTDYKTVKRRAQQIVEVTGDRTMPPWHADPGDVKFSNDRSLSPEQIELLADWVTAGRPEGDPTKTPPLPEFQEEWQIGKPDQVATMTEPFTVPAEGSDIYRNFVIPMNLEEDRWVEAIEFLPGAPEVVHHILYFLDTSGKARKYDAEDKRPGFRMSESTADFSYIGGWDVGTQPTELPYGLRFFIPKGADLVVQIHYHPNGKEVIDQSSVGFHYSDKPTARPWTVIQVPPHFGQLQGIDIKAGEKEHIEEASFILPEDCKAFAVNAHAHYLAKRMELTATLPDGKSIRLLRTTRWDFRWQEDYSFEKPVELPAGTRLDMLISYDNSASNPNNPSNPPKDVRWGPQTTDEMGSITLAAMFETKDQKEATHEALRVLLVNQLIDRLWEGRADVLGSKNKQLQNSIQRLKVLDKDKDSKLSPSERLPAIGLLQGSGFLKRFGAIGFE
ncbi:MAG: hypothetical protein QNL33_11735 [Akkermansiaceae bacterium]|jgi:hypothetical protein